MGIGSIGIFLLSVVIRYQSASLPIIAWLSDVILPFLLSESYPPLPFFCSYFALLPPPGVTQEKIATFLKRLRAEPRYLLAQNVSTCIDPLEVCLHRQTVQDTVHIFQHSIPTEGKPITNQKNSGDTHFTLHRKC